jgi:tripartite-type tricarboxylate transporter receptor subunit TctC
VARAAPDGNTILFGIQMNHVPYKGQGPAAQDLLAGPYVTTMTITFFLPAKTSTVIVEKLQKDLAGILQKPDVKERFNKLGMTAVSNQPSELDALLRKELELWTKVVKDGNIKAE